MNCVLFAKMKQVFSFKKIKLKKYWKNGKKILEKSGNFVSPEKRDPCINVFGPWAKKSGGKIRKRWGSPGVLPDSGMLKL